MVAEVSELKTNTNLPVRAVVLESTVDDKQGILVKVLIQEGILKVGDRFVLNTTKGKVRALINDKGKQVKSSTPSTPIDVLGFESLPFAGEILQQVNNEKEAKTLLAERKKLENNFNYQNIDLTHASVEQKSIQTINIIIKADLQGSLDALVESLNAFNGKEVFFGKVNSLKHYKDDVKELISGQEGGIGVDEFQQFKIGDLMEFYI